MIKIWDLWIRFFHWSLAFLVIFLIISGTTGAGFYEWHKQAGEAVLALLLFRILWSFAGSSNASILGLLVHPKRALSHLLMLFKGDAGNHRGHNAAGGWAVIAMLVLLLVQAVTGFFIADEEELIEGALYGSLSSSISYTLYDIHHWNATLLKIIIPLHVIMIGAYFVLAKVNLLFPMITGKMHWNSEAAAPNLTFGRWWVGLLLLVVVVSLVFFVTRL